MKFALSVLVLLTSAGFATSFLGHLRVGWVLLRQESHFSEPTREKSFESGLDTNIVAEDTTRRGINDANGSTKRESRSPWRDQSRRDGPRRDNTARRDGPRGDGAPQGGAWRPGRPSARQGGNGGTNTGGGGPALKLNNPLKLQRMPHVRPPRPAQQDGQQSRSRDGASRGGPPSRSSPAAAASRPIGSIDASGDIIAPLVPDGSVDGRRRRVVGGKDKPAAKEWKKGADDIASKKTSLRIGTGKKGRTAEISGRRGSLRRRDRSSEKAAKEEAAIERKIVYLADGPMTVSELAACIDEKPVAVIKYLMTDCGVMASMTQTLDQATCVVVAEGFGKIVNGAYDEDEFENSEESALSIGFAIDEDDPDDLVTRPPVVTIMGHVDHGKTSLLDAIRNTKVTATEAGGITQHIAAYQVEHQGHTITFIDTPGHAAFTDMRERGANITDIVILVVAADDGVKAQTADSIACARQAGVPVVVAINKCDLEIADPARVMSDLTSYGILVESLGGDVLSSEISAKTGSNLDDLLDKVMLQAELQDLKSNPNRCAQGAVVEARVQRGLGTIATTLIQKGTIRIGDHFVAGSTYGKVRALLGSDGKTRYSEAGPSVPINVVGFDGVPSAGDLLVVVDSEQAARELAESRQRISRENDSIKYQSGLMSSVAATFGGGSNKERREMCVVVKADVQGSAEALTRALRELKCEDDESVVSVKVLISETGEVTKSDIAIASVTPGTTVLAFGVSASFDAMEDARLNGVPIEYWSIIYDAIESIESRMKEVLSPTPDGDYAGSATVQEVFNIGGTGNIAGSRCTDGFLRKGANVRVMRGDKILIESKIKSLRNFKSEADRIEEGNECGIGLVDFEDFEPGDVIECYVVM